MKLLNNFSHIYIEERVKNYPLTQEILEKFPNSKVIYIEHYKNLFNRYNQNYRVQKGSMKLILALKEKNFLYEGSYLIQSQNYKNFFYSPILLNCIYDCHYCFLQGIYPSGNIVLFVNIEDFFQATKQKLSELKNEKVLLSISYDSDLLAVEKIFGLSQRWIEFSREFKNLNLEIRTKSANYDAISNLEFTNRVKLNWTLSPEMIIKKFEIGTPSLKNRLNSILKAQKDSRSVGIVIDPIVRVKNYQNIYREFIEEIFSKLKEIEYLIIGAFRMSQTHFKRIKKSDLESEILYQNYTIESGSVRYSDESEIIESIESEILKYMPSEKIFKL